ncbi:abc1 family protein, partial [Cystoisospora suis]
PPSLSSSSSSTTSSCILSSLSPSSKPFPPSPPSSSSPPFSDLSPSSSSSPSPGLSSSPPPPVFSSSSFAGHPASSSSSSFLSLSFRRFLKRGFFTVFLISSGLSFFSFFFPDEARQLAFIRCFRAAWCVVLICLDYKLNYWRDESVESKEKCHERSAQRFLRLAKENRGIYIKLGQHASAMTYLLPPVYTRTLAVLQSQAPTSSLCEVEDVLKKELNIDSIDDLFVDFDPRPVGAASLAQVHFARLKEDRSPVAIKVQHREVASLSQVDIAIVRCLERLTEKLFPDLK